MPEVAGTEAEPKPECFWGCFPMFPERCERLQEFTLMWLSTVTLAAVVFLADIVCFSACSLKEPLNKAKASVYVVAVAYAI